MNMDYLANPPCCVSPIGPSDDICTKCWDREIPDTEETKERDMELNEKFAKMTFAELVDTAASYEKEIENLKDTIESKNGLIGTLKQKIANYEKETQNLIEKNELLLKDNQYVRDANRLSAEKDKEKIDSLEAILKVFEGEWSELKEKNEGLEKDISKYRDIIATREQKLDEKEAKIIDMQRTIDFQERHINRIEGELKLYKGMKVDTNKTDYTKPEAPICNSVPSSAVIGKIHCLKANWVVDEEPHVVFKLPRDAVKKLTGKDNWSNIDYLIMPTDMYKDVLNKDLEEHMKKYRDQVNQYMYYSRFLDSPCLNVAPDTASNTVTPVAKDYKAIAEHNFQKFTALQEAGFTEDQAMSLIPVWTDDDED